MTRERNEALQHLTKNIKPRDATLLLDSLRWKEDAVITNHFGERVWLRVLFNSDGVRLGITECCFADDPCLRHKNIEGRGNAGTDRR